MDEKTEQLRSIFMAVADDETVTESQEQGRGSLAGDEEAVDERLQSVIDRLREKFDVAFELTDERLIHVVREFYAGADDEEVAAALGCPARTVFETRTKLHLLRDDEPNPDLADAIRELVDQTDEKSELEAVAETETERLAAELGVGVEAVERAVAAMRAGSRSRRASHRFRTAYEEVLTDADLTVQFAADAHEDGLAEATEGAEVDVDF